MKAQEIVAQVTNLQAPSESIVRLSSLVSRTDGYSEEVIELAKRDAVLCAKLLSVCNSAHFGLAEPIGSVEQAVFYLGYRQIYQIVVAVGFGDSFNQPLTTYAMVDQDLWRHSLVTAQVAELLIAQGSPVAVEPSLAYTAGLVHDIGKIVLNQVLSDRLKVALRELVELDGYSRLEAERAVLQADHCELGACLLRQWRLPETIIEAVENHHQPIVAPQPALSAVVHLADCIAHQIGSAPGWRAYAMSADASAASALEIDSDRYASLVIEAHDQMSHVKELAAAL